jgi:hypothetical protein
LGMYDKFWGRARTKRNEVQRSHDWRG